MTSSSATPGQIIIARHGEPDANRYEMVDWRGYERWWAAYDEAGLKPGQVPPAGLVEQAGQARTVFASTLPRAIETARACVGGRELIIDPVFVEAPLPPPRWPGRFPARTWGVFARCTWWLGAARGRETRPQAELRARQAAAKLVQAADAGPVALYAHGWFNRMLRPALRAQGWRCVIDGRDDYWSWRRYERR
ncbi:histidine phosphatase family protein [Alkalicaulis satelles]|uniref:Histidine phosphatase family protein n=1 Tax=Alkalicaulis satelles TaxID=2609175 RepID=A0A5M6ZMG7_9PROT|nr:histidine phosphatase family protein [Alkalicaulis satelles]KAA5805105.1 histidine phosphatase family protein [Alkalicaulis satelles]